MGRSAVATPAVCTAVHSLFAHFWTRRELTTGGWEGGEGRHKEGSSDSIQRTAIRIEVPFCDQGQYGQNRRHAELQSSHLSTLYECEREQADSEEPIVGES